MPGLYFSPCKGTTDGYPEGKAPVLYRFKGKAWLSLNCVIDARGAYLINGRPEIKETSHTK
jgi:hypothetical protein